MDRVAHKLTPELSSQKMLENKQGEKQMYRKKNFKLKYVTSEAPPVRDRHVWNGFHRNITKKPSWIQRWLFMSRVE